MEDNPIQNRYTLGTYLNTSEVAEYMYRMRRIHDNSKMKFRSVTLNPDKTQDENIEEYLDTMNKIEEERKKEREKLSQWAADKFEIWSKKPWNRIRIWLRI